MKTTTKLTAHPLIRATRAALRGQPRPSLQEVMEQAKASEEWRKQNGFAKSVPSGVPRK